MFFLSVIEFVCCVALILIVITQMLVPSLKGTKMWPMFRREQNLENEIRNLNQQSSEVDLENEVKTIRKNIKTKRSR